MKPDTTTAKSTTLTPSMPKPPAEAGDGINIGSEELSTAAHINDIKNPLTNINMAVESLSSMVVGAEEKRCLDIILRSSNRIHALLAELIIQQQRKSKRK